MTCRAVLTRRPTSPERAAALLAGSRGTPLPVPRATGPPRRPMTLAALNRQTRRYEAQKCSQPLLCPPGVYKLRECLQRIRTASRKRLLPCPTFRRALGMNWDTIPRGPRHTEGERADQTLGS